MARLIDTTISGTLTVSGSTAVSSLSATQISSTSISATGTINASKFRSTDSSSSYIKLGLGNGDTFGVSGAANKDYDLEAGTNITAANATYATSAGSATSATTATNANNSTKLNSLQLASIGTSATASNTSYIFTWNRTSGCLFIHLAE